MSSSWIDHRAAGILLHPTSLPAEIGKGDLGPEAYHFVDFILSCGVRVWQMLPICPTQDDGSPYQSTSVNAGNPDLISLELLRHWGWLDSSSRPYDETVWQDRSAYRREMLLRAQKGFEKKNDSQEKHEFDEFIAKNHFWLKEHALFIVLRESKKQKSWNHWPKGIKNRNKKPLQQKQEEFAQQIQFIYFEQFVFDKQWHALRRYANERGVKLFGDIPIFVSYDSVDVWAHRQYFLLDDEGEQYVVSGVPPDYFSADGQMWGNPCYNWQALQEDQFAWWKQRLQRQLDLFDIVRIDHFRGLESYWEIPAHAETAKDGHWVKVPGQAFFQSMLEGYDSLPLVAEDLGLITPEVDALRDEFNLPGMRIFQFGFDGNPNNPHLPHNFSLNTVAYSGTHDNDTVVSWFESLPMEVKGQVLEYMGVGEEAMPWAFFRTVVASVARLAVLPMQDILQLGQGHRMNTPGTADGNWQWRFQWSQIPQDLAARLYRMNCLYNRVPD